MKTEYSVLVLCNSLEVSTSGYYDWLRRQHCPSQRAQEDRVLAGEVKRFFALSRGTYGVPRIQRDLRDSGRHHGGARIQRLMKLEGLCGRQKGRFRPRTTDSDHPHPIAPNRLAKAPPPESPNQTWVADITYIPTQEGWLYLAAVLDLYSRKIVGWAMSPNIDTDLVLKALQMALLHRQPPEDLVFHSDRGVQYASATFRRALYQAGLIPSMSRRANCYDNAAMESFWSTLKLELVYRTVFLTRSQARRALFDFIEGFYNTRRRHSALGLVSPSQFEYLIHPKPKAFKTNPAAARPPAKLAGGGGSIPFSFSEDLLTHSYPINYKLSLFHCTFFRGKPNLYRPYRGVIAADSSINDIY